MELLPLRLTPPIVLPATDQTRPVRSITLSGHGRMERMKILDAPLPKAVSDDHVEVEVSFCGLNFTDNYLRLGIIRNRHFPVIMGSECSGIVVAVGKDVTDLKVGQKVLCLKMQGGLFRHCVHVQSKYCFPLPDNISLKDAVGLGLHFVVAHFCLYELGGLVESGKIFMHSVAGGVGTALVQLTQAAQNAEVLGTASGSKHDRLLSLGVKWVFDHEENYEEEILKEYPDGVDVVVNTIGGSEIENCLKILKPVGRLVLLGSNTTATYPRSSTLGIIRPRWDSGSVASSEIISRIYCVSGVNIGVWLDRHPEAVKKVLTEIFDLYSSGEIQPYVHAIWPFDLVTLGLTQLCQRENFGKVILEINREVGQVKSLLARAATPVEAAEEPKEKSDTELREEQSAAASKPTVVEAAQPEKPEVAPEGAKEVDAPVEAAEEPKEKSDTERKEEHCHWDMKNFCSKLFRGKRNSWLPHQSQK